MANGQLAQMVRRLRRHLTGPGGDATDRELLERYAVARDEEAFTALVRRHGTMVFGVCRRVLGHDSDADDAFQATFLVLARKAGTAFWGESIGNWLYGVAYRTANKLRIQGARRGRHESTAAGRQPTATSEDAGARELRQVLDAELSRLPERYRMPLLLCCLQDQTIDEAARQLDWSCTTVKGRLQRGRELLRERLRRRGIELSAGVLGTIVTQCTARAVPAELIQLSVQASAGGTSSPTVATLAKGVGRAMFWKKMRIAAAALVAAAVVGLGGVVGVSRMGTGGSVVLAAPAPAEAPPSKPEVVEIKGKLGGWRTIGPDGRTLMTISDSGRGPVLDGLPDNDNLYLLHFGEKGEAGDKLFKAAQEIYKNDPQKKLLVVATGTWTADTVADLWKGRKILQVRTLKVADAAEGKSSEPAVKDGLSVTLGILKDVFRPGEPLRLKVVYTNVGKEAFTLKGADYLWNRELQFDDGKTEAPWALRPLFRCTGTDTLTTLEPGKSFEAELTLDPKTMTHKHEFVNPIPVGRFEQKQAALGLGRYRVTIGLEFAAADKTPRGWGGKITSRPVEFAIAEPEEGK
jgi:RNA polymerase sigma factor (sigma-70 family)